MAAGADDRKKQNEGCPQAFDDNGFMIRASRKTADKRCHGKGYHDMGHEMWRAIKVLITNGKDYYVKGYIP